MAQQLITTEGTLDVPGGYASYKVAASNSGIATNGVLMLVGEADAGPDWTLESDVEENAFGPNSLSAVVAKYKSGALVDAYRGALAPSKDPNIQGSPATFVLVKTNVSGKADAALPKVGGGTYALLADRSYGALGNMIYFQTAAKTAEVKPTTGAFTFLPPVAATDISVRVNGGAAAAYTISAGQLPSAFVSGLAGAATSASVTGGADRGVLGGIAGSLALSVSGNVTVTYTGTWATTPSAGDTLYIPSGSVLAGTANKNLGSYVVVSATSSTIVATKLQDASGTPGQLTVPVAVSSTAVAATSDVEVFSPVVITTAGSAVIDGVGKSLEIAELTTNTDRLSNLCYALTSSKVAWVSTSASPQLLTSATEYSVSLTNTRQADQISESMVAGGNIALLLGYKGTTATVTITATTVATTVTGGAGASIPSTLLSQFPTLNDLAKWINSHPGYTCSVASAAIGQISPLALDEGTFSIASTEGVAAGRIKYDAYSFFSAVSSNSALVQVGFPTPVQALAGLPDVMTAPVYLAGGTRGGTSDAQFQAAIDALEAVDGNFIVPLFSRDATGGDIVAGATDSTSTYTIDSINAYVLTHCIKMSALKRKRNRQGFCSKRDTYANNKKAAANLASHRVSMSFEDVKDIGANGLQQFPPWMGAIKAAATQAAGFYRAIFWKSINCSGAVQAAGDWNPKNDDNVSDALRSGLLPIIRNKSGAWIWSSDQTTYIKDDNFILNSIQGVYAADIVSMTAAQRMQDAFVGESLAEVDAAQVLTAFGVVMAELRGLKLIGKSDDAPLGYKNTNVTIAKGAILVETEAKVAGAIYFAKVGFLITEITQSASQ